MKFYKNKWFWGMIVFAVLSISWSAYTTLAQNNIANQNQPTNDQQNSQVIKHDDPNEGKSESQNNNSSSSQDANANKSESSDSDKNIQDKLNKVKDLQELQKKKNFMLIIAQDDLEHYTWGEKSQFSDIWKQAYLRYGLNGNLVMQALQYDVDTYLTYGTSDYALVWSEADLSYEFYKTGKMKASMTAQQYQQIVDNLNAVQSRLGIIYGNREYTQFNGQDQPQQAPY